MNNKTLAFYNKNAKAFAEETAFVDFKETQDKFINILQGKRVLDFGCGAEHHMLRKVWLTFHSVRK